MSSKLYNHEVKYLSWQKILTLVRHKKRHNPKLGMVPEGTARGFGFRIIPLDRPSYTVVAQYHICPFVHPEVPRAFTVRELATFQSFPLSFVFEGGYYKQLAQVGNTVPPSLAEKIKDQLKVFFREATRG